MKRVLMAMAMMAVLGVPVLAQGEEAPPEQTENQKMATRLKDQINRNIERQIQGLQRMRERMFAELDATLGITPNPDGSQNAPVTQGRQNPLDRFRQQMGDPNNPGGGGGLQDLLRGLGEQFGLGTPEEMQQRMQDLRDQFGGNLPEIPGLTPNPTPAPEAAPAPEGAPTPEAAPAPQGANENLDQFFNRLFGPNAGQGQTPAPEATPAPAAEAKKGKLGFRAKALSADEASLLGIEGTAVVVDGVSAGSAAEKGGLKAGDVVVSVDGKNVDSMDALRGIAGSVKAGQALKVVVLRDGAKKVLTITASE